MSPTLLECIEFSSHAYGVPVEKIINGGRNMELVWPRWVAMKLCRTYTGCSLQLIAQCFGRKDHTTIINGLTRLQEAMETNKRILRDVESVEKAFVSKFNCEPIDPLKINGYRMSKYSVEAK